MQSREEKVFKNIVPQAKEADPGSWYWILKIISNYDQNKQEELYIEEIAHLPKKDQVEEIAKAFNAPSQKYSPLQKKDIIVPEFDSSEIPQFTPYQIQTVISQIKTNKATLPGDIPAKVMKRFSAFFCTPLTDIINHSLKTGTWPAKYKVELITPVPKVCPTEKVADLRPISNLPICNKIAEKVIS